MDRSFIHRDVSRRRLLAHAGVGLFGLNSAGLRLARANSKRTRAEKHPNACIFVFLFGGPSHVDLWDMKPQAPAEVRGEFQPIQTVSSGVEICEHLPRLARHTDKLCLLRSTTHHMPVHGPACSEVYSGREYFGPPVTDQASPRDWPSLGSLVARFGSSEGPLPASVVLPWYTQFVGQEKRIAGQTGGRMGEQFNPFLVQGNPAETDFRLKGLDRRENMCQSRLANRFQLRRQLDRHRSPGTIAESLREFESQYTTASSMLGDDRVAGAFDLRRESSRLRDRYGRTRFGQSLLLARRLVESGVSLVTVNWDDDHKTDKVSPHWDTHVDNFPKLKDRLCPPFDQSFSAFLEDLGQSGLLESTMVVALGEFGRTPKIGVVTQNGQTEKSGRDHWPHAFTTLLAGGPVPGGTIHGATTANGGYVDRDAVSPADLTATVLTHLGVDPGLRYRDGFLGIRQSLSIGRPLFDATD